MRAVADIGSHWLDLIGFIAGLRVTRVFTDFVTILPRRRKPTRPLETFAGKELAPDEYEERPIRTEDFATVVLRFADGAPGVMTVSQVSAGHKNRLGFEINGADASLAWNSERPEELWVGRRERASELLQGDPALLAPEARSTTSYPGGHAEGFPDTFKALYERSIVRLWRGRHRQRPTTRPLRTGCGRCAWARRLRQARGNNDGSMYRRETHEAGSDDRRTAGDEPGRGRAVGGREPLRYAGDRLLAGRQEGSSLRWRQPHRRCESRRGHGAGDQRPHRR